MARRKRNNQEFPVYGVSGLGGNSVEATGPTRAEITDDSVQAVPLVWDERVGEYVSELAKMELDDEDITLRKQKEFQAEEEWRAKVGYVKT